MWTEKDEKEWKELTDRREENKEEVGKIHTINLLKQMISSLEKGEDVPSEIEIGYIRGPEFLGYPGPAPIIGKKIILIFNHETTF